MSILIKKLDRCTVLRAARLPVPVIEEMAKKDTDNAKNVKWIIGCVVPNAQTPKPKFLRSVEDYVDDRDKRRHFVTMISGIFDAACYDDYQEPLKESAITCKPALSVPYENKNHTVWELKHGNKDRIYFFTLKSKESNVIILITAFHKKNQETPDEIRDICEKIVKKLLSEKDSLNFC